MVNETTQPTQYQHVTKLPIDGWQKNPHYTMNFFNSSNIDDDDNDFHRRTGDAELDRSSHPEHGTSPALPVPILLRSPQEGKEMARWYSSIPHVQQTRDGIRCTTKFYW